MKNELERIENFIEDLDLILKSNDEYFIKYCIEDNSAISCLSGDKVDYWDLNDSRDVRKFVLMLLNFIDKNIKKNYGNN